MEFKQAFNLAINSLKSSKMRSFLTMLGIIIGVAAVIILVSIVDGFSNTMMSSFESLGTNLINVNVIGRGSSRNVTVDEMIDLSFENPDVISYVSPSVSASASLKNGNTTITSSVTGCNEYFDEIKILELSQGRFLEYMDMDSRSKVCVIGTYVSNQLFETTASLGKTIKVNGDSYKVVGVLEEKAGGREGSNDDCIYIPYTLATKINRSGKITSYVCSAADTNSSEKAVSLIEKLLYSKFQNEDFYHVLSMSEIVDSINELMDTLTLVLVGIAAISLLVGGIGIMNIMLVSVTERTREIGIRKSLGAKPWDILSQFVVEAATTSSVGGIIGIILGAVVAYLGGKMIGITVTPSIPSVIISFTVSAIIGIAFGYFPAKKASKLNPIDALNHN